MKFWIVSIAGIAILAWLARGLLLPVFLAMMLAYLLSPLVGWTDALAIRRSVAVGAIFSAILLLGLLFGLTIGPRVVAETSTLVERLPVTAARVVRSNPARVFDREAVNAVRRWRFQPVASPVTTRREISFNPQG